MPICTTAAALTYLGISSPNATQTATMDMIRTGLESSLKQFCRWCVVETSGLVYFLPKQGQRHGSQAWQLELDRQTQSHDRMQLPQMHVSAVSEVRVDLSARGGVAGHFASDTILTAGDDYFLEPDGLAGASASGGLLRVNSSWPNLPGTVKVTLTAGFSEAQLAGEHNILRMGLICECAAHWARRQQMEKLFTTGLGAADTTGLLAGFKMGEFEAKYRDPESLTDLSGASGSYAISSELQKLLQDHGYVFEAVGAA